MILSILLGLAFVATTWALGDLGINCRGAYPCWGQHSILPTMMGNLQHLNSSDIWYMGTHILCVDLAPELAMPKNWGFCLFMQADSEDHAFTVFNPLNGSLVNGVDGGTVKRLFTELSNHGCKGCGSVPFADAANDPHLLGILTVNYVTNTNGCNGCCEPDIVVQSLPTTQTQANSNDRENDYVAAWQNFKHSSSPNSTDGLDNSTDPSAVSLTPAIPTPDPSAPSLTPAPSPPMPESEETAITTTGNLP